MSASSDIAAAPIRTASVSSSCVIAGFLVKFRVGASREIGMTVKLAPACADKALMAAPPASKFATICAVTSLGYAETPSAAIP